MFCYITNLILLQFATIFFAFGHDFVEIFLDILKYEVGFVYDSYYFLEFDDVGMIHFAKCFNLRELKALFPGAVFFF